VTEVCLQELDNCNPAVSAEYEVGRCKCRNNNKQFRVVAGGRTVRIAGLQSTNEGISISLGNLVNVKA
jgi:uncharacterized Zn-binding protein involved in type VI secretion